MEYSLWLENRALELRRNPTSSEKSLMKFLKRYKVSFRFQVPIMCRENKGYIADFLFSNNIILEVDGESHSSDEAKEYELYDIYGNNVGSGKLNGGVTKLPVSNCGMAKIF
jgi:very-short-patch-repair endonuclease